MQFAWRPAVQPDAPMEAAVVTAAGQLLKGILGGPLKADALSSGAAVACAAWSADGSALALASEGAAVTVRSAASGATFRARMQSKACSSAWLIPTCGWQAEGLVTLKPGAAVQDANDLGADLSIIGLAWVGERAILVSGALHAKGKEALVSTWALLQSGKAERDYIPTW